MNDNTPNEAASTAVEETVDLFIAFQWSGADNGTQKTGFDSRVVKVYKASPLTNTADFKGLAEELGKDVFKDRKYVGLEITIINVVKLPI